jgi:membrane-associated phospholipid phosphatase
MNWTLLIILIAACALLMLLERLGVPTTLALNFKGDVKRETRWLAQYGQSVSTAVGALLIWRLDRGGNAMHQWGPVILIVATALASGTAMVIKRLLSRVRPGREGAGTFLGPSWSHANWRESFPSSHSASAVAFSVILSLLYWPGAAVFWTLALICAALRYIMDAHWPSDVLGGIALGYGMAHLTWWGFVTWGSG